MEPMLLEDYRYGEMPQTVKNLLEFFQRNKIKPNKNDIVVGFIYILMLEMGFIDKNCTEIIHGSDFNYQRLLRHSKTLPQSWKRTNSYQMDFILKLSAEITCNLVCVPVADDLLINCTVRDTVCSSLLIDPLTYFTSSKVILDGFNFQNLNHLARTFKDSIALPAKHAIMDVYGGVCASLQHLPQELLVKIMCFLEIDEVLNLAQTCRYVCLSAQNSALWVKLLDKDFRRKNVLKTYEQLRVFYEIKYFRDLDRILDRRRFH